MVVKYCAEERGESRGTAAGDHTEYNEFSVTHGRVHRSPEEYRRRLGVYLSNMDQILETNSRNLSYRLGPNRFTDWTHVRPTCGNSCSLVCVCCA